MRSSIKDSLPPRLGRSLAKLGQDIRDARRKRHLTVEMMVERTGVSKATYLKVEKGDPSVSMGTYATVLFILGMSERLADVADSRHDSIGRELDEERLPQRIRLPRQGAK